MYGLSCGSWSARARLGDVHRLVADPLESVTTFMIVVMKRRSPPPLVEASSSTLFSSTSTS